MDNALSEMLRVLSQGGWLYELPHLLVHLQHVMEMLTMN